MQRSLPRLRDERHRRARAARRARRPQARAPPRALRDVRRRLPPRQRVLQVRPRRRRRHGPVPPARRLGDLRRPGAPRAAWSLRYPLVAGQGNFGSPGNDRRRRPPVHRDARWRRSPWRWCATSTRTPSTSRTTTTAARRSPTVLPGRFPNLLVNGSVGIAVGMATNIPPHNLREVADGRPVVPGAPRGHRARSCSRRSWSASRARTSRPARTILGRKGIEDAYRTGRGSITMRAVVERRGDPGPHLPRRHRAAVPGEPRQPRA